MTQSKSKSGRSLAMSIISLVVCVAMLAGATFAWLTDSATSGINQITSGNLDVAVSYKAADGTYKDITDATSLFSTNLWEPGHTEYVTLKVENLGTLAFNYKMSISVASETAGTNVAGESFSLSDYLVFGTTTASTTEQAYASRDAARAAAQNVASITESAITKAGSMSAGAAAQYVTLVVYMPETVGNEVNYKTGTAAPTIDLGITVTATQKAEESDSFDNQYDANADGTTATAAAAVSATDATVLTAKTAPASGKSTTASFPAGALDGTNAELTVVATSIVPTSAASKFAVLDNENGVAVIDLTATVDGNEVSTFNGQAVTVTTYVAKGLTNVVLKYNGTDKDDPTDVTYNAETGELTFKTTHFSQYVLGADETAYIAETNTAYAALNTAIDSAASGETVYLIKDSDGKSIGSKDSAQARESLTIDFNGHTYTVTGEGVGSTGTETQAMHWGTELGKVTIKNGAYIVSEKAATAATKTVKMALQGYIPITAENMTFDFSEILVAYYTNDVYKAYPDYYLKEVPIFNVYKDSTFTNCEIIFNPDANFGFGFDEGATVTLINTQVAGTIFSCSDASTLKVDSTSSTGSLANYMDYITVTTTTADGYTVYTTSKVA